MKYKIVNPIIIGKFKSTYDVASPIEAAKKFWGEMSSIIMNELPETYFTMKDDSDKLHHFKVTEERSGSHMADYMISPVSAVDEKAEKSLIPTFNKVMSGVQKGGKKHRLDDDSSSSSSDDSISDVIDKFKRINALSKTNPIVYYHYNPLVYRTDSIFIPNFIYPNVAHYMEIGFSTAFWG